MAFGIKKYLRRSDVVLFALLAANILLPVASAICLQLSGHRLTLALDGSWSVLITQPWTLLTYMFSHGSLIHLGVNMLWLYCFARLYMFAGRGRGVLALYLGGGVAGAVAFMTLNGLFADTSSVLIGSSASIVAIAVADAVLMPDRRLSMPLFGDIKIKWIVIFVVLLFCLGLTSTNAGGNLAHLGGALWGLGYAIREKYAATSRHRSAQHVDLIIEKAKLSGYDALTDQEKQALFRNFSSRR